MGLSRSLWAAAALAALLVGRADGACVEEWESEGTALPPADQVSRLPYQLRTLLQLGQGGFALAPEAFPPFAGPFPNQAGTFNNQARPFNSQARVQQGQSTPLPNRGTNVQRRTTPTFAQAAAARNNRAPIIPRRTTTVGATARAVGSQGSTFNRGGLAGQSGGVNGQAGGAGFQSQSPSLLEYILLRIQAYRNKPRVPLVQRVANFFGGGGVTGNVVNVLDNL